MNWKIGSFVVSFWLLSSVMGMKLLCVVVSLSVSVSSVLIVFVVFVVVMSFCCVSLFLFSCVVCVVQWMSIGVILSIHEFGSSIFCSSAYSFGKVICWFMFSLFVAFGCGYVVSVLSILLSYLAMMSLSNMFDMFSMSGIMSCFMLMSFGSDILDLLFVVWLFCMLWCFE